MSSELQRKRSARSLPAIIDYARQWVTAGGLVVQDWESFEQNASVFFCVSPPAAGDTMHGLMHLVCSVCFGSPDDVKLAARSITPNVLAMGHAVLSHLPEFSVLLDAEMHYRRGMLAGDWSLIHLNGKLVVRSEFRQQGETEPH